MQVLNNYLDNEYIALEGMDNSLKNLKAKIEGIKITKDIKSLSTKDIMQIKDTLDAIIAEEMDQKKGMAK